MCMIDVYDYKFKIFLFYFFEYIINKILLLKY